MQQIYREELVKLIQTINSCVTTEQMKPALRYAELFFKKWLIPAPPVSQEFEDFKYIMELLYEHNLRLENRPLKFEYSARVRYYYERANKLFNNYIGNSGNLDYPDKEYGWLMDELEKVEVGFFKDNSGDSTHAQELIDQEFNISEEEAYDILKHRVNSIIKYLN